MKEQKLDGGSVSSPVRVGNTVRRPVGAWTPTVHALLDFLHRQGFTWVPQPLGFDEQGREVLTYLPGESALRPWISVLRSDEGLRQMAQLVHDYHEAVAGFVPPADAVWQIGRREMLPGQIIRHGDLGPWNTLWSGERVTGLIDWDFAEPAERITDLAQLAWYFVPLRGEVGWRESGFEERPDFWHRIAVLCEAYGTFAPEELVREVDRLQHEDMQHTQELGGSGVYPWNLFWERGGMTILENENAWLRTTLPTQRDGL